MNSLNKKHTVARGRPLRRSSLAAVKKAGTKRVRRFELSLPFKRQLVVCFRKFRTNPNRQSKRNRQLIIELNGYSVREIAFIIKRRRRSTKKPAMAFWPQANLRTAMASGLIIAGISSAIIFGINLQKPVSFNISSAHNYKVLAAPRTTKVLPASIPTRLQIPKIGIDANLAQVDVQASGVIEMPWDITVPAWYKYSPTPGQLGPSVIVGHLDGANYINMAGVFYRLNELAAGDQILITRADGTIASFKVLYLKQVPRNNFPTQEIYGNINYAGIRLITCGGTFNNNTNLYTDNTVVFGALE